MGVTGLALPDYDPGRARRAGLLVVERDAALVHADDLARDPGRFSPEVGAMLEYGRDARVERLVKAGRLIGLPGARRGGRLAAGPEVAERGRNLA